MANPFTQHLSTIESLASTIDTDHQTYNWFKHLLFSEEIYNKLIEDGANEAEYTAINGIVKYQKLLIFLLTIFLIYIFVAFKLVLLWGVILFAVLFYRLYVTKKNSVVKLSSYLITHDFQEGNLEKRTFYQICEYYSKKYQYPSFVNYIQRMDHIYRKTIIYAFIAATFVYPLSFWQFYFVIFACVGVVYLYTTSSYFVSLSRKIELKDKG